MTFKDIINNKPLYLNLLLAITVAFLLFSRSIPLIVLFLVAFIFEGDMIISLRFKDNRLKIFLYSVIFSLITLGVFFGSIFAFIDNAVVRSIVTYIL
jgi:hypothetical protein